MPSEDKRAAEAFIRNYTPCHVIRDHLVQNFTQNTIQLTSGIQEEAQQDVLAQHHKKNHSYQPPELSRLSAIAIHQAENHEHDQHNNVNTEESDNENEEEDQAQAARDSKSTSIIKPNTLAYYKGSSWSAILTQAKVKYHHHIALHHGFPNLDKHLSDAHKIPFEAMAEYKDENGIINKSE